jgi:hypothetical protein
MSTKSTTAADLEHVIKTHFCVEAGDAAVSDYVSNDDYQRDFLAFFGIAEYNELLVAEKMDALYGVLKDEAEFGSLMKTAAGLFMSEDPELGLSILFSYDYLPLLKKTLLEDRGHLAALREKVLRQMSRVSAAPDC